MFLKLVMSVTDFFYPPSCPNCGKPCDESKKLCIACRGQIAFVRAYDGKALDWLYLDKAIALAHYRGGLQDLLQKVKFSGQLELIDVLTNELSLFFLANNQQELVGLFSKRNRESLAIIPVPTDSARLTERGYDLPQELYYKWCKDNGFAWYDCLERVRTTRPQFSLSGIERRENMKGAVKAKYLPTEKIVIIVDDILTTGATLVECARAIREAGGQDKLIVGLALASDA